jgi:hypothetical protein
MLTSIFLRSMSELCLISPVRAKIQTLLETLMTKSEFLAVWVCMWKFLSKTVKSYSFRPGVANATYALSNAIQFVGEATVPFGLK